MITCTGVKDVRELGCRVKTPLKYSFKSPDDEADVLVIKTILDLVDAFVSKTSDANPHTNLQNN